MRWWCGRLREYLAAEPFPPFRVFMSDGSYHDVPHPEFAWLIGNRFFVAKIVKGRGLDDPAVRVLSILDLLHIAPIAKPKRAKQ